MTIMSQVAALAVAQGGFLARTQLTDLGMSASAVDRRVANGEFDAFVDGVYRLFVSSDSNALLHAAVLGLRDAVVSHESAARLHGIRSFVSDRAVVSVDASTTYRFPKVIVHRNRDLRPEHRQRVHGLPVTSLARTVFDLAGVITKHQVAQVVDELIGERRLTTQDLRAMILDIGKRGKPGTATMRAILQERGSAEDVDASKLEQLGLRLLEEAGLPRPVLEYSPPWSDSIFFDAAYPESRLAIEWDSRRWHMPIDRFEHDRRRDRIALLNGWAVMRFTWDDVVEHSALVGRQVAEALASRDKRPA